MKISYIKAENYKSILKFEAHLSPGVNVFVGPSDSGKSNVVRMIRDFFFNASGDGVVTAKQTRCSIAVNDCIWEKGKGLNRYVLPMGTFENVGRTSPQELRSLFKVDEIQWDDTHSKRLQFIQQHEPKFFLDESFTGSLNAKILGLVSGIQRTYNGNKLVINDIRDAKGRRDTALSIKVTAETDIVKYNGLPKQKHILDVIEKSLVALKAMEQNYNKLVTLYQETENIHGHILNLTQCIPEDALAYDKAIQSIYKDALATNSIRKVMSEAKDLYTEILQAEKIDDIEIDIDMLNQLRTKAAETIKIKSVLSEVVTLKDAYKTETTSIKTLESDLETTVNELQTIVNETDTCPLINDQFCVGCKDKIIGCVK